MPIKIPCHKTIQFRLLTIVLSFVLASSAFFIVRMYEYNKKHIEEELEQLTTVFIDTYHEEIDHVSKDLFIAMEALILNPQLVRYFADRDRESLHNLTHDFFNQTLKSQYGINQFQFHLAPARSFLRGHKPLEFGDELSGFRKIVLQANETLKPVRGVEFGRYGIGLRIVNPVFHEGIHVGSVELGLPLKEILKASAKITKADYAIGVYKDVFDSVHQLSSQPTDVRIDDLVFYELSNSDISEGLFHLDQERMKISGRGFFNKSFPLTDFRGVEIGQIVIFKQLNTYLAQQKKELLSSAVFIMLFAGMLCIVIIIFLQKAFVKPVKQAAALADALAAGNLDYQIVINGNSEIKRILKALCQGLQNLKNMQGETIRSAQMASIGEMSASVAHEINNPISGVINYSQILLNKKDLNDRQRDLLTRIQKEGDRVAGIVHNLLNYARDSKGQRSLTDIKEIVVDSLVLLNPTVKKHGVEVDFEWPETLPQISCNVQQIEQVLVNVFRNAYQSLGANPQDNRKILVSAGVITVSNQNYLQLIIANNGPSIPPEVMKKIMEPFFTTKPAGTGTGLGLSISATIMKEHKGELEVESVQGGLTEMILRFPVP